MFSLRTAVWICFTLLAVSDLSSSLKCYTCAVCNDPFKLNDVQVEEQPNNQGYYCTKISATFVVQRGISKSCDSVNVLGNGQWCCQKDLCNHTARTTFTYLLLLPSMIIAFIKFF